MNAKELFHAGRLEDAIQSLVAELKNDPGNDRQRTFLFELLCFAGAYDRAEKQLDVLAQSGNKNADLGTLLYRGAMAAERTRQGMFETRTFPPSAEAETVSGTLDDRHFEWISDADPRIGPKLEVFAAGAYMWIPYVHIESIEIPQPRRLRDLLWTPAVVRTGPAFADKDLGEVLLPAMCPLSAKSPDDSVRLGRSTLWEESAEGAIPLGQKVLIVDDEEIPLLQIRHLTFATGASTDSASAAT
ncbi:MAG: type VI secretion system accessory protein TagJ [Bryobacteraceae bacterium]|jgi:type VI secretion system protein ImpE